MQQKPCTLLGQRMFLKPSRKQQNNTFLEESLLDPQPASQTPQFQKSTKDTAKYSVKLNPKGYPNPLYGTMQLNYYPEHQTPSHEGYSHSLKKRKQKCTNSYKNTSREEQSACPNPPMQPTSSLWRRKMENYDQYKTTDPSISGPKRIEMYLPSFLK